MVLSASRRFLPGNPGLIQKLKVPKWVCRSSLASFCHGQPFSAIFGPARGQIFGKTHEKITKNWWMFVFLGFLCRESYREWLAVGIFEWFQAYCWAAEKVRHNVWSGQLKSMHVLRISTSPKGAIFPSFFEWFFIDFSNFSSRSFKFSILLRRGPGLGPGDPARALAQGLRRRMENVCFFSTVFSSC